MSDDLFYGPSLEHDSQPPSRLKKSPRDTTEEDRALLRTVSKKSAHQELYQTASLETRNDRQQIQGNTMRRYNIVFSVEEGSIVARQNFENWGSQIIYMGDDLERAATTSNEKIDNSRNRGWIAAHGRAPGSFLYVSAANLRQRLWEIVKADDPNFSLSV